MDLYVILGLPEGASEAEIRRAYRRLARRFHPDINPGDAAAEERFRQILEAYETLIDPARRSSYDSGARATVPVRERCTSGFEGFDFSSRGSGSSATFGDLFAEVLTERASTRLAPVRGADLHQEMRLSFGEALAGVDRRITVTRRENCRACGGTGLAARRTGTCPYCEGTGAIRTMRGYMVFTRGCDACGGTGQERPRPCEPCGGAGQGPYTETVHVRIPAGVADGERVRIPGGGNAGIREGQPGDLLIDVHVAPHPDFRREGDDIHVVVAVGVHEAALGARVVVAAPDGEIRLRVPPGTQSGQRFRFKERGAPSTRGGRRGDLIVEVRLMLPSVLDERSKELLREFGRIHGENVRETSIGGRPQEQPGSERSETRG